MVDISLCNGKGCKMLGTCYRYLSLPCADPLHQSFINSFDCIEHDYVAYMGGAGMTEEFEVKIGRVSLEGFSTAELVVELSKRGGVLQLHPDDINCDLNEILWIERNICD